jgi:hypothetical protein
MEISTESEDRLPNGQKAEFANFKFPDKPETRNDSYSSESSNSNVPNSRPNSTGSGRLPNGQRAQFSNFKFSDNETGSSDPPNRKQKIKPEVKKSEIYPFQNFKFPDTPLQNSTGSSTDQIETGSSTETEPEVTVVIPKNRKIRVYDIKELKSNFNPLDNVDDSVFEVTTDDVKMMQKSLNCEKKEKNLLTRSLREKREKEEMIRDFRNNPECRIKINFVNQTVIEIIFHPGELISTLAAVIREQLIDSGPFNIFTTPPKVILKPNSTVWACGLCPRGNVYVSLAAESIRYKPEVWEKRLFELEPAPTSKMSNSSMPGSSGLQELNNQSETSNRNQSTNQNVPSTSTNQKPDKYSSRSDGKKVPKWFKGTGKSYK